MVSDLQRTAFPPGCTAAPAAPAARQGAAAGSDAAGDSPGTCQSRDSKIFRRLTINIGIFMANDCYNNG